MRAFFRNSCKKLLSRGSKEEGRSNIFERMKIPLK